MEAAVTPVWIPKTRTFVHVQTATHLVMINTVASSATNASFKMEAAVTLVPTQQLRTSARALMATPWERMNTHVKEILQPQR